MDENSPRRGIADLVFVRLPYLITGTLFLIAVAINFVNVVGRYLFSTPVFWAEEVLVFMVIWSVFLAAASIVYRGEQINMDWFYAQMASPWKEIVNTAIVVLLIACSAIVVTQSFKVVSLFWQTGAVSVAAGVPMYIPHTAILVGFSLIALAALVRLRSYVTGRFD